MALESLVPETAPVSGTRNSLDVGTVVDMPDSDAVLSATDGFMLVVISWCSAMLAVGEVGGVIMLAVLAQGEESWKKQRKLRCRRSTNAGCSGIKVERVRLRRCSEVNACHVQEDSIERRTAK